MKFILAFMMLFYVNGLLFAGSYTLGIHPSHSEESMQKPLMLLSEYIYEKTGHSLKFVVPRDFADNTIDMAWISSVNYIKAKNSLDGVRYIATVMNIQDGMKERTPYFHAYILSLKRSGLKTLEDLRGKKFAFIDFGSTSGYAYPNKMLRSKGIVPSEYFEKTFFLKRHDRVVPSLLRGSVDAAATSDGAYFKAVETYGDIFNVVDRSGQLPFDTIIAAPDLDSEVLKELKDAFTSMPLDHIFNRTVRELFGFRLAGFADVDDSKYNELSITLGYKTYR